MKTLVVTAGLAAVLIAIAGQTANSSMARNGMPVAKPVIAASSPFTHSVRTARAPRETLPPAVLTEVVQRYCQTCHNAKTRNGNLSLEGFDVAAAADRGETTEMMIHKLRAK